MNIKTDLLGTILIDGEEVVGRVTAIVVDDSSDLTIYRSLEDGRFDCAPLTNLRMATLRETDDFAMAEAELLGEDAEDDTEETY